MNYADLNQSPRKKTPDASAIFWTGAVISFICLPLGLLYAIAVIFGSKD